MEYQFNGPVQRTLAIIRAKFARAENSRRARRRARMCARKMLPTSIRFHDIAVSLDLKLCNVVVKSNLERGRFGGRNFRKFSRGIHRIELERILNRLEIASTL
jgi:hypothetical protein